LAEEEELFRIPFLALLQKSGYKTIVAVDGPDALAKAEEYEGEIHLLPSNILMPAMTESNRYATSIKRPRMRILLMSTTDQRVFRLGQDWQFVSKPFRFQTLKQN
jgi:CheY-like chemotaxis protein